MLAHLKVVTLPRVYGRPSVAFLLSIHECGMLLEVG